MLNKQEKRVMSVLYEKCAVKGACLLPEEELRSDVYKKEIGSEESLMEVLKALELDDYFDLIQTQRENEKYYCITLHAKGVAFKRELQGVRRQIVFKIVLTIATAILSFFLTRMLYYLFKGIL